MTVAYLLSPPVVVVGERTMTALVAVAASFPAHLPLLPCCAAQHGNLVCVHMMVGTSVPALAAVGPELFEAEAARADESTVVECQTLTGRAAAELCTWTESVSGLEELVGQVPKYSSLEPVVAFPERLAAAASMRLDPYLESRTLRQIPSTS